MRKAMKSTRKRGDDFIDRTPAPRVDWVKVVCYGALAVVAVGSIWVLM
ncbi:MAG: hypothetical protein OXG54_05765 [Gammaproteobacteria bacterium]|nr:hypothetical protein [Gammaproteobacteria bacterium]